MQSTEKPDYKFWAKKDTWTLKEAALLLHRREPLNHRSLKPYHRNIPAEFSAEQKTYILLHSVPWRDKYSENIYNGIHPYLILMEALNKELPIPSALLKAVKKRFEREQKNTTPVLEKKHLELLNVGISTESVIDAPEKIAKGVPLNEPTLTTRERRNLLKTIAILVHLLIGEGEKRSPRYSRGTKLNVSQIAQTIIEKAQKLGIELEGLKSLNRKLSEALDFLDEESISNNN